MSRIHYYDFVTERQQTEINMIIREIEKRKDFLTNKEIQYFFLTGLQTLNLLESQIQKIYCNTDL